MNGEEEKGKVKFEVYGEEMLEKTVKQSGDSGRVYLPPAWVGSRVKIIRIYIDFQENTGISIKLEDLVI